METKNKDLYVVPAARVVELKPTGVLCTSDYGLYDPNDYSNGGDPFGIGS